MYLSLKPLIAPITPPATAVSGPPNKPINAPAPPFMAVDTT
ncbi:MULTISPECIES: hypothetical protein [unclassified Bartonella]